jgi:hypothetical protein
MLQMQCVFMAAEKYTGLVLLLLRPLHMCAHLPVMYTLNTNLPQCASCGAWQQLLVAL